MKLFRFRWLALAFLQMFVVAPLMGQVPMNPDARHVYMEHVRLVSGQEQCVGADGDHGGNLALVISGFSSSQNLVQFVDSTGVMRWQQYLTKLVSDVAVTPDRRIVLSGLDVNSNLGFILTMDYAGNLLWEGRA